MAHLRNAARVKAFDRRIVATHEAGHALMAVHLGYDADVWIYPHVTDDPLAEKTWLGHMTIYNRPDVDSHPHNRMVAVAGMVAETLWKDGRHQDFAEPWGWDDYLWDDHAMSYSDWHLACCTPGEPDEALYTIVAEVAGLFMHDLWPGLNQLSRILMRDADSTYRLRGASVALAMPAAA